MRSFAMLLALVGACESSPGPVPSPNSPNGALIILGEQVEIEIGGVLSLQVRVTDPQGNVVSSPQISWRSTEPGVATVTGSGTVTAVAPGNANVIASNGTLADTAKVRVLPPPPVGTLVEVHPELTYQVMTGWEGTAQIGQSECNAQAFNLYRQEVVNRLVSELGINRVRLEARSGSENPVDYYSAFRATGVDTEWEASWYAPVNDNADPRVIRVAGFQFAEIDHLVETIISPMRSAMQARGERLYVNLNYVDFEPSAFKHSSDPEEYAEYLLVIFNHLNTRYGWVPDAVEMILEPDNTVNWTGVSIGRAMVATGDRLKTAGFSPAFIAPSTTNMATSLTYLNDLVTVPRVLEYLTDFAYHRYSGVSGSTLATIALRAQQLGLRTAMLEHIGASYEALHEDLRNGLNSSWQQFTLAFCGNDIGANYYYVDQSTPSAPRVLMGSRTRYLRQYFSFVRLNAVRIGAFSGDARLDPLAFRNANGKFVVVIRAGAGAMQLRGLPAGTYGVTITTETHTFASLADVVVGASGLAQVNMPAAGVMTVHAR